VPALPKLLPVKLKSPAYHTDKILTL